MAFGTFHHEIRLSKLRHCGIRFKSYFENLSKTCFIYRPLSPIPGDDCRATTSTYNLGDSQNELNVPLLSRTNYHNLNFSQTEKAEEISHYNARFLCLIELLS